MVLERAQKRVENAILDLTIGEMDIDKENGNFFFCRFTYFGYIYQKFMDKKRYALASSKNSLSQSLA